MSHWWYEVGSPARITSNVAPPQYSSGMVRYNFRRPTLLGSDWHNQPAISAICRSSATVAYMPGYRC